MELLIIKAMLLVEDDPACASALAMRFREALPQLENVSWAKSAEEANKALSSPDEKFDVIVLDYSLPGMNGAEFLGDLRAMGFGTPVICYSASHEYQVVQQFLRQGADEFVAKEELMKPSVIERTLHAVIQKREHQHRALELEIVRQRLDALRMLICTIHHELNNPLAVLRLVSQVLASPREMSRVEHDRLMNTIIENVDRIVAVVEKIENIADERLDEEKRGPSTYSVQDKNAT